jgi:hypothetical protein
MIPPGRKFVPMLHHCRFRLAMRCVTDLHRVQQPRTATDLNFGNLYPCGVQHPHLHEAQVFVNCLPRGKVSGDVPSSMFIPSSDMVFYVGSDDRTLQVASISVKGSV